MAAQQPLLPGVSPLPCCVRLGLWGLCLPVSWVPCSGEGQLLYPQDLSLTANKQHRGELSSSPALLEPWVTGSFLGVLKLSASKVVVLKRSAVGSSKD
jgi:hypothetical protein